MSLDEDHRLALLEQRADIERKMDECRMDLKEVERQLAILNVKRGRDSNYVFAAIFKQVAFHILPRETYQLIVRAAQEKLNMAETSIEEGGQWTGKSFLNTTASSMPAKDRDT